jgi:hypothetical protein
VYAIADRLKWFVDQEGEEAEAVRRCRLERPGLYELLSREVRSAFSRRVVTYDSWD